jgi:hypothetical protein
MSFLENLMKNLATSLFLGKDARSSGLIALLIIGLIALGCTCNKEFGDLGKKEDTNKASNTKSTTTETDDDTDTAGIPSESRLQSMVKETTADFARAIDANDFSEIYSKASSDFQSTYSEEEMKNVFKTFVEKKRLILPSLNKVDDSTADFSPAPRIRQEQGLDILVLSGKFPTKPLNVKFDYEYVRRDGEWKLLKLVVNM